MRVCTGCQMKWPQLYNGSLVLPLSSSRKRSAYFQFSSRTAAQPGGAPHGSGWVVIQRTKVAVPVHQLQPHGEVLGQAHLCGANMAATAAGLSRAMAMEAAAVGNHQRIIHCSVSVTFPHQHIAHHTHALRAARKPSTADSINISFHEENLLVCGPKCNLLASLRRVYGFLFCQWSHGHTPPCSRMTPPSCDVPCQVVPW